MSDENPTQWELRGQGRLVCHICNVSFLDEEAFRGHLNTTGHRDMFDTVAGVYALMQQIMQRRCQNAENTKSALPVMKRVNYCNLCDSKCYIGVGERHGNAAHHVLLKSFLHARCTICNMKFFSPISHDEHLLSVEHQQKAAKLTTEESSEACESALSSPERFRSQLVSISEPRSTSTASPQSAANESVVLKDTLQDTYVCTSDVCSPTETIDSNQTTIGTSHCSAKSQLGRSLTPLVDLIAECIGDSSGTGTATGTGSGTDIGTQTDTETDAEIGTGTVRNNFAKQKRFQFNEQSTSNTDELYTTTTSASQCSTAELTTEHISRNTSMEQQQASMSAIPEEPNELGCDNDLRSQVEELMHRLQVRMKLEPLKVDVLKRWFYKCLVGPLEPIELTEYDFKMGVSPEIAEGQPAEQHVEDHANSTEQQHKSPPPVEAELREYTEVNQSESDHQVESQSEIEPQQYDVELNRTQRDHQDKRQVYVVPREITEIQADVEHQELRKSFRNGQQNERQILDSSEYTNDYAFEQKEVVDKAMEYVGVQYNRMHEVKTHYDLVADKEALIKAFQRIHVIDKDDEAAYLKCQYNEEGERPTKRCKWNPNVWFTAAEINACCDPREYPKKVQDTGSSTKIASKRNARQLMSVNDDADYGSAKRAKSNAFRCIIS